MAEACLLHSEGSILYGRGSSSIANLGGSVCIAVAHGGWGFPPLRRNIGLYLL